MRPINRRRAFTLIELMIVVGILSIIAAVALPVYTKYMRRTKTIEATMNLRHLFDASVAYYLAEHSDVEGRVVAKQFPDTTPDSPATNP